MAFMLISSGVRIVLGLYRFLIALLDRIGKALNRDTYFIPGCP